MAVLTLRLGGAALRYEARQYAAGADTDRGRQVQANAPHGSLRRGRTEQAGQGRWGGMGWLTGHEREGGDGLGLQVGWKRSEHGKALMRTHTRTTCSRSREIDTGLEQVLEFATAQPAHAAEQFTLAQNIYCNLNAAYRCPPAFVPVKMRPPALASPALTAWRPPTAPCPPGRGLGFGPAGPWSAGSAGGRAPAGAGRRRRATGRRAWRTRRLCGVWAVVEVWGVRGVSESKQVKVIESAE